MTEGFIVGDKTPLPRPLTQGEGRYEGFIVGAENPLPRPLTQGEGRYEGFIVEDKNPSPGPSLKGLTLDTSFDVQREVRVIGNTKREK